MTAKKGKTSSITHSTHIGSVTGQVHTGSGDIIVKSFSVGNSISNKDDFLAALSQFKGELVAAREKGLNEDITTDTLNELQAAEQEATKETPNPERILGRLKQAQEILTVGMGIATTAKSAVTAVNGLLPLLANAIHIVGRIF